MYLTIQPLLNMPFFIKHSTLLPRLPLPPASASQSYPEWGTSVHLPSMSFLSWQRRTVLISNSKIQTFEKPHLCLSSSHQSPTRNFSYSFFISLSMNNHMIHCTKYYYVWFGVLPRPCQRCFITQNVLSISFLKFENCISEDFPGGSDGKASTCSAGDLSLIPGSRRSPGEGNGYPLQYSCLRNPMDRQAIVHGSQRVRHDWVTNITTMHQWNVSNPRRSQWRDLAPVYVEQEDPAPSFTLFK